MTKLYSDFATLYHQIYPSFIDYEEQYRFYTGLLKKYGCQSVLEMGCGTGHLARRMLAENWDYLGMDLSPEMLEIARNEVAKDCFTVGDMRNFQLKQKVDAIIIPARSVSYLIENKAVMDTFQCFQKNLVLNGKLIFDVIDAKTHLLPMNPENIIIHTAQRDQKTWERQSIYRRNLQTGWTWDWHSTYYEVQADGSKLPIAEDQATLRAFLSEEIVLFLQLTGFKPIEILEQGSYAFKNFVFVAENASG